MSTKKIRKVHTAEFKAEALKLADKIGVAATARELKLHESQLYKKSATSQREAEQAEDLAILKKAATYFAKNQK